MKFYNTTVILLFFGLLGPIYCSTAQNKEITVSCAGAMREIMQNGNLSAHASLDTLLRKPNIIALGPLEGLKGEVTVINSTPYITKAKGVTAETTSETNAKAAFLVYSEVPEWEEFVVPSFVKDIATLEEFIVQKAKEQRFNFKGPIPFMIQGTVVSARIHVVDKKDDLPHNHENHEQIKVYFEPTNTEAQMVGFYSTKHKGVFTHHDSFSHIHMVTNDKLLSGHVDLLKLKAGKAKLLLPNWPENQRRKEFKLNLTKKPYKEPVY